MLLEDDGKIVARLAGLCLSDVRDRGYYVCCCTMCSCMHPLPAAMFRLPPATHDAGASCRGTTMMMLLFLYPLVPASLTSEMEVVMFVFAPRATALIRCVPQRLGQPLLAMMKENRAVEQRQQRHC